jgi:hypothetical protein
MLSAGELLSELDGVRGVRISSSTLRRLGVSSGWRHEPEELLQQVIVEDAPLLEKLFLSGLDDHISVSMHCVPKLDFVGSLPEGFSKAKLETTFFQVTTFHFSSKEPSQLVYSVLQISCDDHSYAL